MSALPPLPIYDRLMNRYRSEGAKQFDHIILSTKVNTIMRNKDPELAYIKELLFLLIQYHAALHDREYMIIGRNIKLPYGGKLSNIEDTCPNYDTRQFPPILTQILIRYIEEVTDK